MDLTRFADRYWAAKTDAVDRERLALLAGFVPPGERVLCVDAGPGMLPALLRERGHVVVMSDLSTHAVERARQKGLDAVQVDTDDLPLPFADGSFACVVSDSAIEHRFDPEKQLAECVRVLAPGGTFVLLFPNIAHFRQRLWLLFGCWPTIDDGPTDRSHLRHLGLREVRRTLAGLGIQVTRVRGFPSLWVKGLYPSIFRAPGIRALYRGLTRLRPQLFGRDLIVVGRKH